MSRNSRESFVLGFYFVIGDVKRCIYVRSSPIQYIYLPQQLFKFNRYLRLCFFPCDCADIILPVNTTGFLKYKCVPKANLWVELGLFKTADASILAKLLVRMTT